MGMSVSLVLAVLFFLGMATVTVLIGLYVYRDANRRGMNGVLWTLVALLAPSMIGFIIYLLVRGNYAELVCPSCGAAVTASFQVCPSCGVRLKAACPACSAPVEPGWKVCPSCATPLPEDQGTVRLPVRPKDKTLGKILLAIVLIPAVLVATLLAGMTAFTASGSMNVANMPKSLYLSDSTSAQALEWIEQCDAAGAGFYALRFQQGSGEKTETHYLLYSVGENVNLSVERVPGFFTRTLAVKILPEPAGEPTVICVSCYGDAISQLKVSRDGRTVPCTVSETSESPALFHVK